MTPERRLIEDYRDPREAVMQGAAPLSDLDRNFGIPCFMVASDGALGRAWRHYFAVLAGDPPTIIVSAFQTGS